MKKAVSAGAMAAGLVCVAGISAAAVDGVAIVGGSTHSGSTHMTVIAFQRGWDTRWFPARERHLGGYWSLALGHWNGDVKPGQQADLTEISLTPVFRYQPDDRAGLYLEAGAGVHWLSQTRIGNRRLSTRFQFGDLIGLGTRFGRKGAYDLGYRFLHLSNADIKRPNDGVDFHQIRLQYHFR